ncbi:MAG: ABC transporter ATP-binding protein [Chlorobiaceae bacterium]|nr:ABC transporter ATP-binding protein [Chlorobiaceae bacterium]
MDVAVRLNGVSKKFGSFSANSNISLSVEKGSIHALVGENGAGKSTLTKIIYGMHLPTSGDVIIAGKTVRFTSPREAINAGIGMVHQHFMLVPEMSVTENIVLGNEHCGLFQHIPLKRSKALILKDAEAYGLAVDPDALVANLSIGEQQRVEILKLLFRQAAIMIFDEPTAVLTPSETERLFATLRSLRDRGKTIILITHKLDEVLAVADMVSVMRKGEIVGTMPTTSATKPELARMMVGRTVLLRVTNPLPSPGETILSINHLTFRTPKGEEKVHDLNLNIRSGEIYGIAGVEGNGQSELLQTLWGLAPEGTIISGEALLKGRTLIGKKPADIAGMGVSHIPENRLRHAVIADYTVSENLLFGRHRERSFHQGIGFNTHTLDRYAGAVISEYGIKCSSPAHQRLAALSGGNQQKVVVARELSRPAISLLILAQPTRGVDIGAIEIIHKKILEARTSGVAILLLSSELEEIIALSTRIGCLYKGSIRHEFSQEEVAFKRNSEPGFQKEIGLHIT